MGNGCYMSFFPMQWIQAHHLGVQYIATDRFQRICVTLRLLGGIYWFCCKFFLEDSDRPTQSDRGVAAIPSFPKPSDGYHEARAGCIISGTNVPIPCTSLISEWIMCCAFELSVVGSSCKDSIVVSKSCHVWFHRTSCASLTQWRLDGQTFSLPAGLFNRCGVLPFPSWSLADVRRSTLVLNNIQGVKRVFN